VEFNKSTFVVIHGATREKIHSSPQIGSAEKRTFEYREGQVGLILPRVVQAWRDFHAHPYGASGLSPEIVTDPRYGISGGEPTNVEEIEVIVGKSLFFEPPEGRDDFRLITLGEDEFRIVEGKSLSAIAANIKRIRQEIKTDAAGSALIKEICQALKAAKYLFRNPLKITCEPTARKISEEALEAEKANCQALFEQAHRRGMTPIEKQFLDSRGPIPHRRIGGQ